LAERLIRNEKNAAGFRTAISRSYYAAFLQARDFLERIPIYLVTANPHLEVVAILTSSGDAEIDNAVGLLRDLRDERNAADYDLPASTVEAGAPEPGCRPEARAVTPKRTGCRLSTTRLTAVTTQVRATANRLRGLPP